MLVGAALSVVVFAAFFLLGLATAAWVIAAATLAAACLVSCAWAWLLHRRELRRFVERVNQFGEIRRHGATTVDDVSRHSSAGDPNVAVRERQEGNP